MYVFVLAEVRRRIFFVFFWVLLKTPGSLYIGQDELESTEIGLPLPPKSWNQKVSTTGPVSDEGIRSAATRVWGGCELSDVGMELNPGLLQEQQVLLTAEPSL